MTTARKNRRSHPCSGYHSDWSLTRKTKFAIFQNMIKNDEWCDQNILQNSFLGIYGKVWVSGTGPSVVRSDVMTAIRYIYHNLPRLRLTSEEIRSLSFLSISLSPFSMSYTVCLILICESEVKCICFYGEKSDGLTSWNAQPMK